MINQQAARVLDHGSLVLIDAMPRDLGVGDDRIVQAARVSYNAFPVDVIEALGLSTVVEDRSVEQNRKLIRYMLRNGHGTPFEKVRFEFFVKAPMFVARQWFRYRMGSFNEVSARYSELPNEFYLPTLDRMQGQSKTNKQGSDGVAFTEEDAREMQRQIEYVSKNAFASYTSMLQRGLARELARVVLPTNFYTSWYWTTDLRNLLHFLKERLHERAQWEIRQYAQAMVPMVQSIAPVTFAEWLEIGE